MNWSGQHALLGIRADLFRQIHRLSLGYYAKNEAGNIMSRVTSDTDTIQQALGFALLNVLSGALLMVWIVLKMLQANVAYALLSLQRRAGHGGRDVLLLGPGAQGLSPKPPADGQRQRRPAGEHRRRPRGPGLQPRGREHRAVSAAPTLPTATPTSAPRASPARSTRCWRRSATSRSALWWSSAACRCCATRRFSAPRRSRWAWSSHFYSTCSASISRSSRSRCCGPTSRARSPAASASSACSTPCRMWRTALAPARCRRLSAGSS